MATQFIEPLSRVFESEEHVREIARSFDTPVYVISQKLLEEQADKVLAMPNAFGLKVRFAMKSDPDPNILRIFDRKGIQIDASSGYEAERAMKAGIEPEKILITSQQIPKNLVELVNSGVEYNACSLHQLETFGSLFPEKNVSVRINPGLGSGGTNRTNTGGPASSFGIWHKQIGDVFELVEKYNLRVERIHSHIGSGSDPKVWKKVTGMTLGLVEDFVRRGLPNYDIKVVNLGGGQKEKRMSYEESINLQNCGEAIKQKFLDLSKRVSCKPLLEIEPGTFLVANATAVLAEVIDIKSTSKYKFIITDSGMTEIARPSLYGAQHPISVVPRVNEFRGLEKQIVSGHCCESGDILTPALNNSEALQPRLLKQPKIGDLIVVGGAGAYCSGMSFKGYNSYPEAGKILIDKFGTPKGIRAPQTEEQMTQNERLVID